MDDSEGGCSDAEVAGVLLLGEGRAGGGGNGGGGSVGGGGASGATPGERVLKFELQMYKMRDGEYCIDIQARAPRLHAIRVQLLGALCVPSMEYSDTDVCGTAFVFIPAAY